MGQLDTKKEIFKKQWSISPIYGFEKTFAWLNFNGFIDIEIMFGTCYLRDSESWLDLSCVLFTKLDLGKNMKGKNAALLVM